MTRILSELLGAREPVFQQGLHQLERASGGSSQDIRLTTEILHAAQDRLKQLGLDPQDTTGRELYHALQQRIKEDNEIFQTMLGQAASADSQVTKTVERFINSLDVSKEIFALRSTVAKRIMRKYPPKRAMKRLGYRSLESMLKHEPVALIFAAAHLAESSPWHKQLSSAYRRLQPSDFECREIAVLAPDNARWERLAQDYVQLAKQNIIGLRELGAVVLLPLPEMRIDAAPLAVCLLALQAIDEIATTSTYLKMHQVRPDFGDVVATISRSEPLTSAEMAGSALPWRVVHRYFARHPEAYNPHIFEPHVHPDDLRWHTAADILGKLHPRFSFWEGANHIGMLHKGDVVSMNLTDAVLNFCNRLPYEHRIVKYLRDHIWQELLLRYMHQSNIEQSVQEQLSGEILPDSTMSV